MSDADLPFGRQSAARLDEVTSCGWKKDAGWFDIDRARAAALRATLSNVSVAFSI